MLGKVADGGKPGGGGGLNGDDVAVADVVVAPAHNENRFNHCDETKISQDVKLLDNGGVVDATGGVDGASNLREHNKT